MGLRRLGTKVRSPLEGDRFEPSVPRDGELDCLGLSLGLLAGPEVRLEGAFHRVAISAPSQYHPRDPRSEAKRPTATPSEDRSIPAWFSINQAPKLALSPMFATQPGFVGVVRFEPPKILDRRCQA